MGPDSDIYFIFLLFYIIGSLPFALIVHKLLSTNDPRELGSKNPGATNMYRVAGPLAGVLTFRVIFSKVLYLYICWWTLNLQFYILQHSSFSQDICFPFSIDSAEAKVLPPLFGFLFAINFKNRIDRDV
ncbi:MAG: hypothetical protein Ct9H90mP18_09310 [Gammaproteobacteria bacterium]|nr:MAG: hypothetical protein Ct9H90mP18_09310 [Gammaproteobacteria bacterium]